MEFAYSLYGSQSSPSSRHVALTKHVAHGHSLPLYIGSKSHTVASSFGTDMAQPLQMSGIMKVGLVGNDIFTLLV